ncbi:MAG: response regulator [Anaerolineae bacterium]|nr:response regulator [Anaerolineae bacterium]
MGKKKRIKMLVIEDDLGLAEMLEVYFNTHGFDVLSSAWGEKAFEVASKELPDIILLDIRLPDIDGFEVCRRLRESHKTRGIPVIFLTERHERKSKLQGLEMGVVDYITKPFDIQELRLRIRNTLARAEKAKADNPVTGLPERNAVTEMLKRAITTGADTDWGMLAVTLQGIEDFRELYGFIASDDVLRVTSLTLKNAAEEIGGESSFCGHLGDSTFVLIVHALRLEQLRSRIIERIAESLKYFYPGNNREKNAAESERLGLRIGKVTAKDKKYENVDDLKKALLASCEPVTV